ncbi:Arc family DNA-binding protein [Neorhizobium galegae]|uniref:Arc family DNA-binding protein n=1 Tax=Neorhizobium galegae TaxID=399 RepID=UPI0009BC2D71|nr:Arc family DNA-binding protein [Neorhizobium galegae]KAB1125892.1 Arc family DNA-binding protein [Neorhizobium galegae]MCQ1806169.1 Arc family DNA-binding protein [Neorhizobium galegae]
MSKKSNLVPMSLRMPPEILEWLKRRAAENGRSNNREIIQILKAAQQSEQCQQHAA